MAVSLKEPGCIFIVDEDYVGQCVEEEAEFAVEKYENHHTTAMITSSEKEAFAQENMKLVFTYRIATMLEKRMPMPRLLRSTDLLSIPTVLCGNIVVFPRWHRWKRLSFMPNLTK